MFFAATAPLTRRTCPSILCVSTSPRRLSRKCTTRASVTERCLVTHRFCTRSFTTSVNVGGLTLCYGLRVSLGSLFRNEKESWLENRVA